jgi:hypothetical protein
MKCVVGFQATLVRLLRRTFFFKSLAHVVVDTNVQLFRRSWFGEFVRIIRHDAFSRAKRETAKDSRMKQ